MKRVLFIVGATGIGKTALSLEVARHLEAEIVSADSRQIYKLMDIGTAKPSFEQRSVVHHHFIDIKFPDEYYSAGQFATEARSCINEIFSRKRQPIVVGGSGLYIRALVDGLSEPKVADQELKANLKQEAKEKGLEVLYERLQVADPVTAEKLHSNDSQRIMRALEVTDLTEEPYSKFLAATPKPAEFEPVFIGLHMDRSKLYERIEQRVDLMLKQGLLGEVKNLQALGYDSDLNALQSVGYQEAFRFLAKELTYSEMVTLIKQKTRNYAKRQMTWFRKDKRINWIEIGDETELTELAEEIINLLRAS